MRLLNTRTLQLETFLGPCPQYAILSHTWEVEEVTLEDMKPEGRAKQMKGYGKLKRSARLARHEGYKHIWVDTCCIDKSSSAELSEAINSMFQWYKDSAICYAYIADVADVINISSSRSPFHKSKWFTRGWTLQELVAPKEVIFIGQSWNYLGTRLSLAEAIAEITSIPVEVLKGGPLDGISAAVKMSWASRRITTRPEDMAYCLLGLFDVNMPLLYGEGQEKAFMRLQEGFLKVSDDETIFAWRVGPEEAASKPYWGLLATSPSHFKHAGDFKKPQFKSRIDSHPTEVTNRGLRIELSLAPLAGDESQSIFLAFLQCVDSTESWGDFIAIVLQRLSNLEKQYTRIAPDTLINVAMKTLRIPVQKLTSTFVEEHQRLGGSVDFDKVTFRASEIDPEGQVIFVRPAPRESESLAGIYFYPEAQLNASVEGSVEVTVHEHHDPWKEWGDTNNRWKCPYYMIDFQHEILMEHLQPGELEARNLERRKTLGCLQLHVKFTSREEHQWESSSYLVIGIEPLPPNPFGTASGYLRPWYSFANGINKDSVLRRFTGSDCPELSQTLQINDWLSLQAEFGVGTRFSRICHRLDLIVTKYRI